MRANAQIWDVPVLKKKKTIRSDDRARRVDVEERRLTDDPGNIVADQESNLIDEEQMGRERASSFKTGVRRKKHALPQRLLSFFFPPPLFLPFAFLAVVLVRDVDWTLTNDVHVRRRP